MSVTTEPAAATVVGGLLDESRWTGKIFSDGWVDAPVTIETVEQAPDRRRCGRFCRDAHGAPFIMGGSSTGCLGARRRRCA